MKQIIYFLSAFPPSKMTAGQNYTRQLLNNIPENIYIDFNYFDYEGQEASFIDKSNIISHEIKISKFIRFLNCIFLFWMHPLFTNRFNLILAFKMYFKMKKADLIYLNFSQVFLYGLLLPKKKKIMMLHDVIVQKVERNNNQTIFKKLFYKIAFLTERFVLSMPNTDFLCFSDKDKNILQERYNITASVVNSIIASEIKNLIIDEFDSKAFCFFGAWNRKENSKGLEYFIDNVAPLCPHELLFYIIGPNLPKKIIERLNYFKNFKYVGFIQNPYISISRCSGLLAPLFQGAGIKVKVIESLACGTHVIGTKIATEGIECSVPNAITNCESAVDFVNAIAKLHDIITIEDKINLHNKFIVEYEKHSAVTFVKNILS
jgi:glycosyltransferase involved in cell wall biosynthesis